MKPIRVLLIAFLWIFSIGTESRAFSAPTAIVAGEALPICGLQRMPAEVRNDLAKHFPDWKAQGLGDLGSAARERWNAEKPLACPGIAVGRFANTDLSYALLLVQRRQSKYNYELVVFDATGRKAFGMSVVRNFQSGARNVFIHSVKTSKFADESSKRRFHMHGVDSILFVDASSSEYESDIYFWTGGSYKSEPIDY